MTNTRDSLYPKEWRRIAEKDWHRMLVLLEDGDPDGAAYFLQQSLEKYLKAFLLENGWKMRKIHELDTLLDYAIEFKTALEDFKGLCERVTGYYYTERYPMVAPSDLTTEDVNKDKAEAERFIKTITM